MDDYNCIFNALETRKNTSPNTIVYSYANEQGEIERDITWKQLDDLTGSLTGFLRTEKKLNKGDRVLLVYPPSIDFVIAFAGCMRAGLVPVPVYPPNPRKFDSGMEAFIKIAHDCDAQLILTSDEYERTRNRGGLAEMAANDPERWSLDIEWISSNTILANRYDPVIYENPKAEDIALIQYTSGSTSSPKGVVLTHGNLSHQVNYNQKGMNLSEKTHAVFWVPQYHDLGLIGGIVTMLAGYGQLTLFSPFSFIKRPALWFELIHKTRATVTAAPNFAYDLALQKTTPEQRQAWDLSCLEMVMSAAEPVQAKTVTAFIEGFSVSKFNPKAYLPAYGMAEHTVGITLNGGRIVHVDRHALEIDKTAVLRATESKDTLSLVSCGSWDKTVQLRIVNPETCSALNNGEVGEIWADSPSKAAGYWNLPEKNIQDFKAATLQEPNAEYLRTGDLGFILDNELYICGRIKDMLIIGGRNIYPQDIESSAMSVNHDIKPLSAAAFTVNDTAEEKLILLIDTRKLKASQEALQALANSLQKCILEEHQIACHAIVIAPIGSVLKTTSGKVRRQACRETWLNGQLKNKALFVLENNQSSAAATLSQPKDWPEGTTRKMKLKTLVCEFLNLQSIADIDDNVSLIDQGLSSLMAIDFCQAYELATGEELSVTQLFNHPSINELDQALDNEHSAPHSLDDAFSANPDPLLIELHALRHYLKHNRYTQSGFRLGDWAIRPATIEDSPAIHALDQQEYGWLGEDATDDELFIRNQISVLNADQTPWFWLIEKRETKPNSKFITSKIIGWYIMQPTWKKPHDIKSWADATSNGEFTQTLDFNGDNLYLVAGGISREYSKQAHRLMVLNAISLMSAHDMKTISACLAMPGFSEANQASNISPEAYVALTDSNGLPKDAFLAFFQELWPAEHKPRRLLKNGYPPDQLSGGHGVCVTVEFSDYQDSIDTVFDILVQQRQALFKSMPPVKAAKHEHMELEPA